MRKKDCKLSGFLYWRKRIKLPLGFLLLILPSLAFSTYTIITLSPLTGGNQPSANDINGQNQVVGYSYDSLGIQYGVFWSGGTIQNLGTLPGGDANGGSEALGNNSFGQIVGWSYDSLGVQYAVTWSGGTIQNLGTLPGGDANGGSQAWAINHSARVVGYSYDSLGVQYAVTWSGGTIQNLGTLPGGDANGGSQALDINNFNQIVGFSYDSLGNVYAAQWSGGTVQNLGTLPGATPASSYAISINNFGQIAGISSDSLGNQYAVLWSDGTIQNLGTLPGGGASEAFGINDFGQVVGYAIDSLGYQYAVIWSDGTIQSLGTLPGGEGNGGSQANNLNNIGQVVGWSYDSLGNQNAVFWSPLAPSAGFYGTPTSGFGGSLNVNFTDTSSNLLGSNTTWNWNFGDGGTSTVENPSHNYGLVANPTTYTVQLIVTTNYGTSTATIANYISVTEPMPNAGFNASPTSGNGPLNVNFTDTTSNEYGSFTSWNWNFGDGAVTTIQNPSHMYANVTIPTTYTVTLIVTTDYGSSTSIQTNYISVSEPAPSAGFSANTTSGYGNFTVNFTDLTNNEYGASTSWNWTFGDGSTSNIRNPQHVYLGVSTTTSYTVQLIVTTPFGVSTSTQNNYITVTEPAPVASFIGTPLSGYGPLTVYFTDSSYNLFGNNTSWNWNFGDGSTSILQNPSHIYGTVVTSTTYTVRLIVTTNFGTSTSSHANYINVNPKPAVSDWMLYSMDNEDKDSIHLQTDMDLPHK